MTAPDRLHIILNAADNYQRFVDVGVDARIGNELTAQDVHRLLASRACLLGGWVVGTETEVLLNVNSHTPKSVNVKNRLEPPFEGDYGVADKPPPFISQHGDYVFELVRC